MGKKTDRKFTDSEKREHYESRVNDPKLSEGQRKFAQQRLNSLCGGGKKFGGKSVKSGNYTDAQKFAYGAGVGYGAAKSNKRVPVKDENKESFRAGYNKGKKL